MKIMLVKSISISVSHLCERYKINRISLLKRFRWDYLTRLNRRGGNKGRTKSYPGFDDFMSKGVHTKYIKSVFPSESFPSWQTISTGLLITFVNDISFQGRSINISGNVLKILHTVYVEQVSLSCSAHCHFLFFNV